MLINIQNGKPQMEIYEKKIMAKVETKEEIRNGKKLIKQEDKIRNELSGEIKELNGQFNKNMLKSCINIMGRYRIIQKNSRSRTILGKMIK